MTKEQYLNQLYHLLHPMSSEQRRELLSDYELHFEMASANGQTEEQAIQELGDPQLIARELMLQYRVNQAEEKQSPVRVSRAVFAAVSLGFFNLVFVLGPYLGLFAAIIGLWAAVVALWLAPLALAVEWIINEGLAALPAVSGMALLAGLALLATTGMRKLTKGFMAMTVRYLKWNSRMIKEK